MRVFTGRIRPTTAIADAVGSASRKPVEVMALADTKEAASARVESHLGEPSEEVWARKLRMSPGGQPPAAIQALVDSGLLDITQPSCWVWTAMFHGRRVVELTEHGAVQVGIFRLDTETGTFEVAPFPS